jgi:hypothetical protein
VFRVKKREDGFFKLLVKLWLVLNHTKAKKGRGLPEISKMGQYRTIY